MQDKIPVDDIREAADQYRAEGMDPSAAMARAVEEHLEQARREQAKLIAHVRQQYVAAGGTLPELDDGKQLLNQYSADDVRQRQDEQQNAAKQRETERAQAERDERARKERKDVAARMDDSAEHFQLGQSADDALSGQRDIFMSRAADDLGIQSKLLDYMDEIKDSRGMVKAADLATWVREQDAPGAEPLAHWLDVMGNADVAQSSVVKYLEHTGNQLFSIAPGFYSALARTVPGMEKIAGKDGTVKADQALAWLAARQKEGKFKADELQWSGVEDWLKAQHGRVSVAEIAQFIKHNGVQVEEVFKGNAGAGKPVADMSDAELRTYAEQREGPDYLDGFDFSDAQARQSLVNELSFGQGIGAGGKYAEYVLPGGRDYRELLLTLPTDEKAQRRRLDAINDRYSAIMDAHDGTTDMLPATSRAEIERLTQEHGRISSAPIGKPYQSSHWDEPNVVAHVRFNDRTDADGKRVLFIEELQSDWGQDGLKHGIAGAFPNDVLAAAVKGGMSESQARSDIRDLMEQPTSTDSVDRSPQWRRLIDATAGSGIDLNEAFHDRADYGVPNAPFVGDTKAWLSLGIKRMIRYAAENGYDRVAFVNGEQSADRYDLSKKVSKIEYASEASAGSGARALTVYGKGNEELINRNATPAELPDIIGKEMAERLLATEPKSLGGKAQYHVVSGDGLKVGGEGMKSFYDKIVPQTVNDVLKKLGGGRAGMIDMGAPEPENDGGQLVYGDAQQNALHTQQVGFDITPGLREKALEGMPLFSRFNPQRRQLLAAAAAAALAPRDAGTGAHLGRAEPIDPAVLSEPVAPRVEKILRDGRASGEAADNGLPTLRRALQEISLSGPKELRELAMQTERLLPMEGDMRLTIDDTANSPANGMVDLTDVPHMRLYTADGRTGLTYETVLHESMHVAVAARYHSLARAVEDGGEALGLSAPAAAHAIAQFHDVWNEFRDASASDKLTNADARMMLAEARRSPDEFFVRTLTDPVLQQYMASKRYQGRTLWARFKDWVQTSLFGREKSGVSPSWLDAALAASHDLTGAMRGDAADMRNARGEVFDSHSRAQVESPEFKRWFGDSKVVDENGQPLVVYHGTGSRADFDVFKTDSELGAHFGNSDHANYFADSVGTRVIPAYIKIENPVRLNDAGSFLSADIVPQLKEQGLLPKDFAPESKGMNFSGKREAQKIEEIKTALEKAGFDGVVYGNTQEGDGVSYIVFRPEQIKSATGNRGTFDPNDPNIMHSRHAETDLNGEPDAEEVEARKGRLARLLHTPKSMLQSAVFHLRMTAIPMDAGDVKAISMGKDFANQNRRAAAQWKAFDKVLRDNYTDGQLEKMWVAADQENDLRRDGRTSGTLGLASLSAGERKTVELLHAYGQELWNKARAAGLVDGDGVAFWTPRVAARIAEDGSAESIRQASGEFSKDAKNLRTSASSMKHRKYETTAESEAAGKAKHGDDFAYVKNIRVMPMAMAQLEKAIAGRTLVNQIRAHGKLAGDELVSTEAGPAFVTIDHPALKQWRPRMDWQPADTGMMASRGYDVRADGVYRDGERLASYRIKDGEVQKLQPLVDSDGKPVMESSPLYIRKDFAGPLKAVFTGEQNTIYRGLMNLKGAVTSVIMLSPLTHNLVIWGKAMPTMISTMGWKNNLKNSFFGIHGYVIGNRARQDHALMNELIEAGLVPVSGRGMTEDAAAIHNGIEPGRSMTAKALGAVFDVASPKAGDAARRAVDKAGEVWHEKLLWNRVADLQAGMAVMMRTSLMDKGIDQYAANRIATHFANRYAGMIPGESMSQGAHMLLNLSLFSKSFTMTNLGAYKDVVAGLPKDARAQIQTRAFELQRALGKSESEANDAAQAALSQAQVIARKKALSVLVLDVAAMTTVASIAQSLWQGQTGQQITDDFKERLAKLGMHLKDDPLSVLMHPLDSLGSLSQTADNPHGKEDRVRVGEDEQGNSYYMRLPVGKVGEEIKQYGNLTTGMHLAHNKMSTFLRPIADLTANEDFTGKRIINPDDNIVKQAAAFAAYWVKSQLPVEEMKSAAHLVGGTADHMDKLKLMGMATGLSVGRLAGGDEVAEMRYQNREQQARLRDVLPDAREAVRRGDTDKAQQMLEDAGQTPREAMRILNQIDSPDHVSASQRRKFNQHASEEERARIERMRARAGQ